MNTRSANRIRRTLDALEAREVCTTLIQVNTIDSLVSSAQGRVAIAEVRLAAPPSATGTTSLLPRAG